MKEVKNFNQLSVGDKFWRVYTDYRSHDKPTFTEIIVKRLEIDVINKEKFFIVNYSPGYYGSYDFKQPVAIAAQSVVNCDDGFYTTDYDKLTEGLRLAALKYIKEHEDQILVHKERIQGVRKAYFEYLSNPLVKEPLI